MAPGELARVVNSPACEVLARVQYSKGARNVLSSSLRPRARSGRLGAFSFSSRGGRQRDRLVRIGANSSVHAYTRGPRPTTSGAVLAGRHPPTTVGSTAWSGPRPHDSVSILGKVGGRLRAEIYVAVARARRSLRRLKEGPPPRPCRPSCRARRGEVEGGLRACDDCSSPTTSASSLVRDCRKRTDSVSFARGSSSPARPLERAQTTERALRGKRSQR